MVNDDLDRYRAEVGEAQRKSFAERLFRAARLLNELGLERLRTRTGHPIRAAHTTLFPHISLEGTRLTELAQKVGTSKQAVAQLVGELETMRLIEKIPDPNDGRAKLITFVREPGKDLLAGLAELSAVDAQVRQQLGAQRIDEVRDCLTELIELLEAGSLSE